MEFKELYGKVREIVIIMLCVKISSHTSKVSPCGYIHR